MQFTWGELYSALRVCLETQLELNKNVEKQVSRSLPWHIHKDVYPCIQLKLLIYYRTANSPHGPCDLHIWFHLRGFHLITPMLGIFFSFCQAKEGRNSVSNSFWGKCTKVKVDLKQCCLSVIEKWVSRQFPFPCYFLPMLRCNCIAFQL